MITTRAPDGANNAMEQAEKCHNAKEEMNIWYFQISFRSFEN